MPRAAAQLSAHQASIAAQSLRNTHPDDPVLALISAGTGPWSVRSLVARAEPRASVRTIEDLPAFFAALGDRRTRSPQPTGVALLAYEFGDLLEPLAARRPAADPVAEFFLARRPRVSIRPPRGYEVGPLGSSVGRAAYTLAVRRALAYIEAGDIYQVNLTHPLGADFAGDPRAFAADVVSRTGAWFGAYLDTGERAVVSASPELLARVTPEGRITARPIKGTRPSGGESDLAASVKDAAELAMIVDLMRNDLGRVCRLGSVLVESSRDFEAHAGVTHGVATVSGWLRDEASWEDVLRAVFPAGSITGAPKIRARQIIRELEPEPRGAYCGSIVSLPGDGSMDISVCIRTAEIRGGRLRFGVGAGIVADSEPEAEWAETLDKAAGFAAAAHTRVEGRV